VIIPEENAKDLAEIPDNVKNKLSIIPLARMEQVLEIALARMPQRIEWDEATAMAQQQPPAPVVQPSVAAIAH
jgi:ATP-dependent Lon protease